jgi:GMP synthase-like glutamine amidotransferase
MRVIVIRHHDIDEAGFIADAFAARGADFTVHLVPGDGPLPALDGCDHVVVLGAAWSLYDEATVGGWIGAELDWLREADRRGIPVLGICFGAQALSAAHGGQVTLASRPEIGWHEIESLDPGVIEPGPWLEFHSDQCLPPEGARVLARTGVCVQAFALRANLAVQFHPEVDGAQLKRWLDDVGGTAEAQAAGTDPARFLARTITEEPAAAARADRLVQAALRLAAEARSRPLNPVLLAPALR